MTRLAYLQWAFWVVAATDSALLLAMLVMTLNSSSGQNDGGREMALFFFIILPAVVLVLAILMFHFGPVWLKAVALLIVLVPGLWFGKVQIEDRLVDRRIAADRSGVGYFHTEPMRQMGAAVVQRDVDTLMRVGRTVDVDTPGDDMTLMRLAVYGPDARSSDGSELPVVRALLALGASPDAAMSTACMRTDPDLLEMLLAAGGNPNLEVAPQRPLVFETMSVITQRSFRVLVAHGLTLNSVSYRDPLPVQLAIYRRWDLLAIAIELGADTTRARPDGRTVASELASQIEEEKAAGREVPADLLRALAVLGALPAPDVLDAPRAKQTKR